MNIKESWENIENCKCGKKSVCSILSKEGVELYFCWECFFKLENINK